MSWKKIIVLSACLFCLIVAIFLVNSLQARKEAREGKLLDVPLDQIQRITLARSDQNFTISKNGAAWLLEKPLAATADRLAVESLLDEFAALHYERLVESNCRHLDKYGLEKPVLILTFFCADQKKPPYTILIGDKNEMDSSSYVRLDQSRQVVAITAYKRQCLEKSLFDFRDKKICDFASQAVSALAIIFAGNQLSFRKRDSQWFLEKPLLALASEAKISEIIAAAAGLEAKAFLGPVSEAALQQYSFGTPTITCRFELAQVEKSLRVARQGEKCLVTADGCSEVCEIGPEFLDNFGKTIADYREYKLAPFYAFDVQEISFQSRGLAFTLKKNKEFAWEAVKPQLKEKLDEEKIGKLLSDLEACTAKDFVDTLPKTLPPLPITIILKTADSATPTVQKTVTFQFAEPKNGEVLARNPQLPYLFKLAPDIFEKLPKKLADILTIAAPASGEKTQ